MKIPMLSCDDCGKNTYQPAIDVALLVLCPRCAPVHGMDPAEHGEARTYDEWRCLAAERQADAEHIAR